MGAAHPKNVEVDDAEPSTLEGGYRDAAAAPTRVITVRGSSPPRAWAILWTSCALALGASLAMLSGVVESSPTPIAVAIATGISFVVHGVVIARRSLEWSRFSLARDFVEVRSGPMPRVVRVAGWSAREVQVVSEVPALTHLVTYRLFAEGESGARVLLATLVDPDGTRFVLQALRERFADARSGEGRDPFASMFGPLPEGLSCRGDPHDPESPWTIEATCRRANLPAEIVGCVTLTAFFFGATLGVVALAASAGSMPLVALVPCGGGVVVVWIVLGLSALSSARECVLRAVGRVAFHIDRAGVEVRQTPFGGRWRHELAACPDRPVVLTWAVTPGGDAALIMVHGGRRKEIGAPLTPDAAAYAARVIEGFQEVHAPPST